MKFLTVLSILIISVTSWSYDPQDKRQFLNNKEIASDAAKYIVTENKSHKDVAKKSLDALKDYCTNAIHEGCYFRKSGSKIFFTQLKDKKIGSLKGEEQELIKWLQKINK